MAERKAVNKYYPPHWEPSMGSLNHAQGQHPLRDRARKLHLGILIIRFEMPFNIWCLHCNQHIGRGVRFNAEKKRIGMYYSTPILSFRMKCHMCGGWFEIRTNPKESEYEVVEGARRKIEGFVPEEGEVIPKKDAKEAELLATNGFYKLEHDTRDVQKAKEQAPYLTQLQHLNDRDWGDPYAASQRLRKRFRDEKSRIKERQIADDAVRDRLSLGIDLVPETIEDRVTADTIEFEDATLNEMEESIINAETRPLYYKKLKRDQMGQPWQTSTAISKRVVAAALRGTRASLDPFLQPNHHSKLLSDVNVSPKTRVKPCPKDNTHATKAAEVPSIAPPPTVSLVPDDYGDDED